MIRRKELLKYPHSPISKDSLISSIVLEHTRARSVVREKNAIDNFNFQL